MYISFNTMSNNTQQSKSESDKTFELATLWAFGIFLAPMSFGLSLVIPFIAMMSDKK